MTGWLANRVIVAVTALATLAGLTGTAVAQTPIRPHQHFAGVVNGELRRAVVRTVCPGPASRRGPVKPGQQMAVVKTARGQGYTGPFGQIYAWFQPVRSGKRPVMLTFARYGEPKRIPASVRVPCTGSGEAVFSSCPYLAPCPAGWVPAVVKVRFVNVAAAAGRGRAAPGLCARSAVRITARTDHRGFGPGQLVVMTSAVQNTSAKACELWLGHEPGFSPSFVVTRPSGAVAWDRCWGGDQPGRGCSMILYRRLLKPGATYSQLASWDQRYAPHGRQPARVPAGRYTFSTDYQYIGGAATTFAVKPG